MDRYKYRPLSHPDHIRLLQVYGAADADSRLQCEIIEAPLDHHASFEAISYTWEGQLPSETIALDGRVWFITKNASDVLRCVRPRDPSERRLIWIDSVCIDQDESALEERGRQVMLMDRIYNEASRVIVWLWHPGASARPRDRGVVEWLKRLSLIDAASLPGEYVGQDLDPQLRGYGLDSQHHAPAHPIIWLLEDIDETDVASYIDETPWFHRLWTLQEVAMAQNVICLWNTIEFSLDALFDTMARVSSLPNIQSIHTAKSAATFGYLIKTFVPYIVGYNAVTEESTAANLLRSTRAMQCSRHHDRVYALYGLMKHIPNLAPPVPNYGKPVEEVYCDYFAAALESPGGHELLGHLTGLQGTELSMSRSWVPDFSLGIGDVCSKFMSSGRVPRLRHGGCDVKLSPDKQQLFVKGVLHGSVKCRAEFSIVAWHPIDDWDANERHAGHNFWRRFTTGSMQDLSAMLLLWNVHVLRDFLRFVCNTHDESTDMAPMDELLNVLFYREASQTMPDPALKYFPYLCQALLGGVAGGVPQDDTKLDSFQGVLKAREHIATAEHLATLWSYPEYDHLSLISQNVCLRNSFAQTCDNAMFKTLFRTSSGHLGIAPHPIRQGDDIFMYQGGDGPAATRGGGGDRRWITRVWIPSLQNCDVLPEDIERLDYYGFV